MRGAHDDPPPARGDISWNQAPYILGSGVCMGTADVVPGVSGGTMAIALGIYERLLAAIGSVNARFVGALFRLQLGRAFEVLHWRFLICLLFGILSAVVFMLKVVRLPFLLETQPTKVYAVFFGLILASALVLTRRIPGWNPARVLTLAAGVVAGFVVVTLVPTETPESAVFVFASGLIAICAMLLPGISGSFVLLILGKYAYIIGSLEGLLRLDLSQLRVIVPFALGCAVGIAVFARVLGYLLHRWHDGMLAFLTGLLIGSLWRIWPYQTLETVVIRDKPRVLGATPFWPEALDASVLALGLFGFVVVLAIEYVAARRTSTAKAAPCA